MTQSNIYTLFLLNFPTQFFKKKSEIKRERVSESTKYMLTPQLKGYVFAIFLLGAFISQTIKRCWFLTGKMYFFC